MNLSLFGIQSCVNVYGRTKSNYPNRHRLVINGKDVLSFKKIINLGVKYKYDSLNQICGYKHRNKPASDLIVKVEDVGVQDLYDIEIDSEDSIFIANGFKVHNCHISGAEEFQKALYKFRPKYILGVSGTLERKDKAENVFKFGIGDVVSAMTNLKILSPTIYFIDTQLVWTGCRNPNEVPLDRQKNGFLKAITSDPGRNEVIIQNAVKAAKSGRHVLVLSERVNHVEVLYREILKRLSGIKVGMMVGASTKEEREYAENSQVLCATVQLLGVGFNNSRLDTLVMATPIQSVTQAVGRILRQHSEKKPPLVIDLVDGSDIGKIFGRSRCKQYRLKGWVVKNNECLG